MTAAPDDLPGGSHEVCPRCGRAAEGETFCPGCGLNLTKQRQLPTADAYAAGVREQRWFDEQERTRRAEAEALAKEERERREREAVEQREEQRRRDEEAARAAAKTRDISSAEPPRARRRTVLLGAAVLVLLGLGAAGAVLLLGDGDENSVQKPATVATTSPTTSPTPTVATTTTPERTTTPSTERVYFTDDNAKPRQRPKKLLFGRTIISDIIWTRWGGDTAKATGTIGTLSCEPSCAEGEYTYSDVTVTLSTIRDCENRKQYTKGKLRIEEANGEIYNDSVTSSKVSCAQAGREPLEDTASTSDGDDAAACERVKVTGGDLSCARAKGIADAAMEARTDDFNDAVRIRGHECFVYPYAIECSDGRGSKFETTYGYTGEQSG